MKRFVALKPVRFDRKELKTDLGSGNFIFVGSSCDMFSQAIPDEWINEILDYCKKFDNQYLLQTKNPARFGMFEFDERFILGTTIESNRWYNEMGKSPAPAYRAIALAAVNEITFVTIEPVLDFDVEQMSEIIKLAEPDWINIGADTGNNGMPEPSQEKIDALIAALSGTRIEIKKNMKRITERN
jgi:protein gp37